MSRVRNGVTVSSLFLLFTAGAPLAAQTPGSFTNFGAGCGPSSGQPYVLLPAGMRNAFGSADNYFGVGKSKMRYQQCFDGAEVGPARPFFGHAYRMEQNWAGGPQTLEVKIGATTYSPATVTSDFAKNVTSAQTTVFSRKVYNYPPMAPSLDPARLDIQIKWDVPFVWKGQAGEHLLIEILNHSPADLGYYPDAHSGLSSVTRIYSQSGVTASTGTVGRNFGLIMGFRFPGISMNPPTLGATGRPIVGQQFTIDLGNAPANGAAALIFGFSNAQWGTLTLPFDLSPLGANGCSLLVSPDILFPAGTDQNGKAVLPVPIPNDSGYVGAQFHVQFLVLDPAANSFGLSFTDGGTARIGNQ